MPRPPRRSRQDESRQSRRSGGTRRRAVPLAGTRASSELGGAGGRGRGAAAGRRAARRRRRRSRRGRSRSTRPPSAVWPWIAQMGPAPRGGAYTYDWIENLLGLNMHSADRVLPEFQHPAGRRHDRLSAPTRMRIERVEPERVLATRSARRQLGLDVRAPGARRPYAADQPQPLPPAEPRTRGSGWCRWSPARWSWNGRCCAASRRALNG